MIRRNGAIVTGNPIEEASISMKQLDRTSKLNLLNGACRVAQPLCVPEIEEFTSVAGRRTRGKADPAIASFMDWSC